MNLNLVKFVKMINHVIKILKRKATMKNLPIGIQTFHEIRDKEKNYIVTSHFSKKYYKILNFMI